MTSNLTIAIHQPNYLPWLGYFFKIYASDVFVFLDDVQYTKQSLTKRVHIRKAKNSQSKRYLIVPLKKHSDFATINELYIFHSQKWQKAQLNQIFNAYSRSPFFDSIFSLMENWMGASRKFDRLSDFNIFLIQQICDLIKIKGRLTRSSELSLTKGDKNINIELTHHLEGKIYLSGVGGKKYQDKGAFKAAGIELWYSNFFAYLQQFPYPQQQGQFLNGLSILDPLFNIGPEKVLTLFEHYYSRLRSENSAAGSSPGAKGQSHNDK